MTGSEILALIKQEADEAYSMYWPTARWDRAIQEATINTIQNKYLGYLNNQNAFDEMNYFITTSATYPVNATTNTLYLGTHSIPLISIFPTGTTLTVTSSLPHDLLTGTRITFTNIVATGTLFSLNNQTYTVTVIDSVTFTVTTSAALVGVFTSGEITFPDSIFDYYHYLWGQATFTQLTAYTVVKSTNASPIKITLNKRSYLRSGDHVVIAGIGGNTNANGTFYLKQANEFDYFLYSDVKLTTPVSGNGKQTGIGTVSEIFNSVLRFKRSDEKGNVYGTPTVQNPYFQQSKNLIRILPDEPCSSLKIDYIRTPTFFIDVTDTVTDLTNYFNLDMQYAIKNETLRIFAAASRDILLTQTSTISKQENP